MNPIELLIYGAALDIIQNSNEYELTVDTFNAAWKISRYGATILGEPTWDVWWNLNKDKWNC